MASTATTAEQYQAVFDELARVIRTLRRDCPPGETARELLSYDRPGHTALVGIRSNGRRALLHHERDRYAISVEITADGIDAYGLEAADFSEDLRFDRWLEAKRPRLAWLHPRYR